MLCVRKPTDCEPRTGWGCALAVKVLDLAEFDLHLDLVPVNGLREQLDMDALIMGGLNPSLWTPIPQNYAIIHL